MPLRLKSNAATQKPKNEKGNQREPTFVLRIGVQILLIWIPIKWRQPKKSREKYSSRKEQDENASDANEFSNSITSTTTPGVHIMVGIIGRHTGRQRMLFVGLSHGEECRWSKLGSIIAGLVKFGRTRCNHCGFKSEKSVGENEIWVCVCVIFNLYVTDKKLLILGFERRWTVKQLLQQMTTLVLFSEKMMAYLFFIIYLFFIF